MTASSARPRPHYRALHRALLLLTFAACSASERPSAGAPADGSVAGTDAGGASRAKSGAAPASAVVGAPAPAPPALELTADKAAPDAEPSPDLATTPAAPDPNATTAVGSVQPAAAPMLIRTGQASIEVDSLDAAVARVRALAARLGGYVGNTTLAAGREQVRAATLELKLPAARFDAALAGLAPLGRVDSVSTAAEDVGEEFVDVSARVGNARRLEARLLALLERRADKLADVLAVERELARVREEIDRYDGRLRYLRSRVALSTLTVTVHERIPLVGTSPAASPIGDAFRAAWRNFVGFVAGAIAASGVLVPLAVAAWVAWLVARRVQARRADEARRRGPGVGA